MDKVRSYPALLGLEVVDAELFPVISLGDTPKTEVSAAQNLSNLRDKESG